MQPTAAARFGLRAALLLAALVVFAVPFALLLGLVERRWEPLRTADREVTDALYAVATDDADVVTVMQAVSDVGSGVTWWILLSLTSAYLLWRRRRRLALFVAVTGAGGGLLNVAVKELVSRARPELPEPVSSASGFAFPSGHTMGSAIGVGVLLIVFSPALAPGWRRLAISVGVLFAGAVGVSRVVLGVHWFSDVVGGWLLSAAWVLAMVAAFRTWQRESPRSEPSGLGPAHEEPDAVQRHGGGSP